MTTSRDSDRWIRDRAPGVHLHLDVAAAGRVSRSVLDVEVAHLHREAAVGGYVAEQEAAGRIDAGRQLLGALVGLSGDDVAFSDGAGTSFAILLAAWDLPRGSRIGTTVSEYGANARVLARLAQERGWHLVVLPQDADGRLTDVPTGLDLVTFPQVASQHGLLQPTDAVLASGVPLLLDVAQSLGQVPVPNGCAAYVGTSRKWLCGPRGVGFAVVAPHVQQTLTEPPTLAPANGEGIRRWESQEAHVAGRVGLAAAVEQWTPDLLPQIRAHARRLRELVHGVGGWRVREPWNEPTGLTTLVGHDPVATRAALLAAGFVTSAVPTSRSADLDTPVLRVSTAAWLDEDDLQRFAGVLASCTR